MNPARPAFEDDVTVLRADTSVSRSLSGGSGSRDADAPRVLKQRFVLEEKLGSGGMGTVFKAKDLRKVEARDRQPFLAIKVLNNDFREHPEAFIALQREAAKSQALSHPNIVTIYDFDKDGDVPFMTMELLEGQELAVLLRAHPDGLPDQLAWDVIRGICSGLKHAHEAGIVHADFKPGNVFVSSKNAPKILDFGIARAVQLTESQGEDTVFDPARLSALTPAYASREMLTGEHPEPRDDLYSLAVVIYLVLTGNHPYGRVSADEAAREGLKPEKPRRLSRRQWRGLSASLAFDRGHRPENIAALEKLLLQPSPWRSRSWLVALGAFTLALGINYLVGDAELTEVKNEVRQITLVDAQVARLAALLEEPRFDSNWETLLRREMDTLQRLDEAAPMMRNLRARIADAYSARVLASPDMDEALGLLERGQAYGDLATARSDLQARVVEALRITLGAFEPGENWTASLQMQLDRLSKVFADDPRLAEIELEVADALQVRAEETLAAGTTATAKALLEVLDPLLFDAEELEKLQAGIDTARRRQARTVRAEQRELTRQDSLSELDGLLSVSCLRLDLGAASRLFNARLRGDDQLKTAGLGSISERVNGCMVQLAELDPDRASALERETQRYFGPEMLANSAVSLDPCALSYLVGNGAQSGRGGYCADRLADGAQGPKLVVVPKAQGDGRFAMTKQEVSRAQFHQFCVATGSCPSEQAVGDEHLPMSGVDIETAKAYALWLSESTGHVYRLPTADEWVRAAEGAPDPNRNCRVQIDGLQRGVAPLPVSAGQVNEFGLLHMLGNVQEWVMNDTQLQVFGGAFTDPISECLVTTARVHDGQAAANTGFRLVRELS